MWTTASGPTSSQNASPSREMTVRSSSRPSNQAWSILFLSSSFKDSAKTGYTKTSSLAPERQASGLLLHAKLLPVHRGVGGGHHIPQGFSGRWLPHQQWIGINRSPSSPSSEHLLTFRFSACIFISIRDQEKEYSGGWGRNG